MGTALEQWQKFKASSYVYWCSKCDRRVYMLLKTVVPMHCTCKPNNELVLESKPTESRKQMRLRT